MGTQTVVVTGASAGIGRATARLFGERGDRVGLIARGQAGLDGAAKEVEQAGGTALAVSADVADYEQVADAARLIEERLGPIDVWINVAFTSVFSPFAEITAEEFRRVTEVSYLGFVYGTMAALSRMRPRNRGTIVQVGSALGDRSIPLQSAYCGAKHGINGFTSSLRCELLHEHSGVHVTVVQMPAVNTPSSPGCGPGCRTTRSRFRRSTSPRWPRAASSTPPTTPGAGSTGWAPAPLPPSWPTGSSRRCWTGTWPGPATTPSRPRSAPTRTGRTTCSSRSTGSAATISARTASSATAPMTTVRRPGCPGTPGLASAFIGGAAVLGGFLAARRGNRR